MAILDYKSVVMSSEIDNFAGYQFGYDMMQYMIDLLTLDPRITVYDDNNPTYPGSTARIVYFGFANSDLLLKINVYSSDHSQLQYSICRLEDKSQLSSPTRFMPKNKKLQLFSANNFYIIAGIFKAVFVLMTNGRYGVITEEYFYDGITSYTILKPIYSGLTVDNKYVLIPPLLKGANGINLDFQIYNMYPIYNPPPNGHYTDGTNEYYISDGCILIPV